MRLMPRLSQLRRFLRQRRQRAQPRPTATDATQAAIDGAAEYIGRLESAVRCGSLDAAARLTDIAADRVGVARRRMASEALDRLRAQQ